MHKGKRGVLFVFSGPSGVGKGTLKAKLFEEFADQIAYSVSATTRGPREGEVDGKDYFFISRQEFERRVKNNEFLEPNLQATATARRAPTWKSCWTAA